MAHLNAQWILNNDEVTSRVLCADLQFSASHSCPAAPRPVSPKQTQGKKRVRRWRCITARDILLLHYVNVFSS